MKLKSLLTLVAVFGGGLISQLSSAQGIVYLSNTNAINITTATVSGGFGIFFTTGNNAGGYTLDSFALLLAANPDTVGELTEATLYTGTGGHVVNSLAGNAGNNSAPSSAGYDVFTPDSIGSDTSFLAANTAYEIGFLVGEGNTLNVSSIATTLLTGVGGWSYGGEGGLSGNPIFAIAATPVTAVPEPGTLALAGFSLAACWRYCRK
jgi:hypothetical protein